MEPGQLAQAGPVSALRQLRMALAEVKAVLSSDLRGPPKASPIAGGISRLWVAA
jgi:hypothetical protein